MSGTEAGLDWSGKFDCEPATGVWYAVYRGGSPLSVGHRKVFCPLRAIRSFEEVNSVRYGAKDRTLTVFCLPKSEAQGETPDGSGADDRPQE